MSAITGAYLYDQASEMAGWFATGLVQQGSQADSYFQKAIIELIQELYKGIQDQSTKDELYGLVTTNVNIATINPDTNAVYLAPITALNITYIGTTITVTTLLPHNVMVNNTVNMQGAIFSTNPPNGAFTVLTTPTPYTFTYTVGTAPTGTYTENSGTFYVESAISGFQLQLIDYYHLLNATVSYSKQIYPPVGIPTLITAVNNSPPARISLFTYNKFRTGDNLTLSGFSLDTNLNGTFYIDKVNDLQFDLYGDSALRNPITGNGNFVSTDPMVIALNITRNAKPYMPDEKISIFSNPTEENPRYLESDISLKFYPQPPAVLNSIVLDYIRLPMDVYRVNPSSLARPPYSYIMTSDNTLDLSTYYHPRFLQRIPEKVIELVGRMARDNDVIQEAQAL